MLDYAFSSNSTSVSRYKLASPICIDVPNRHQTQRPRESRFIQAVALGVAMQIAVGEPSQASNSYDAQIVATPFSGKASQFQIYHEQQKAEQLFRRSLRDYYQAFHMEPVVDGYSHAATVILERLCIKHPNETATWLLSLIGDDRCPTTAADTIRLLCKIKPLTAVWRNSLVKRALASPSLEIRDAAIQAVESWREPLPLATLGAHRESDEWLSEYVTSVIKLMNA